LIKYVLEDLVKGNCALIERATIVKDGNITETFGYMKEYGGK
jgi:hypothetical protein